MSDSTRETALAPPPRGSEAANAFFKASGSDLQLLQFITETVLAGDWVTYVAGQALDGKEDFKERDPARLAKEQPGSRTSFLRGKRQTLLQMFVSRSVDNLQTYLVDLIRIVLRARPDLLKTSKQSLTLEEILKHDTIDDLVHEVIERKVSSLSYEGFAALQEWCCTRGIPIQVPDQDLDALVELIATRNVIAHARGVVDERYARTVTSPRFKIGTLRKLQVDDFFAAITLLHRIVSETDNAATEKFGLPCVEIMPPKDGHGAGKSDERSPPPRA